MEVRAVLSAWREPQALELVANEIGRDLDTFGAHATATQLVRGKVLDVAADSSHDRFGFSIEPFVSACRYRRGE
ncbi:MAG: hypothetical protein R3B96_17530 [Pirellulaceae bacterium]